MTRNSFMHYIQMLYAIHGIPMHVFSGEKLLGSYEPSPCPVPNLDKIVLNYLIMSNTSIVIYQAGSLILFGAIQDKKKKLAVTLGPVRAIILENDTIEQIARRKGVPAGEMAAYLDRLPVITAGEFSKILSGMHTAINDEIVPSEELYQKIAEWKSDISVAKTVLHHEDTIAFNDQPQFDSYEIEQQLLYYVRNGMVDELKARWLNINPENLFTKTNDFSIRNAKSHCILGLALITDAAIKAGVPAESAFKIRELYIKKAEKCISLQQVMQLRSTILCDFTERVRRIHFKRPDSPLIDRAVSYILKNITSEITLSKVADHLNTGITYLSTRFKEEMGISFVDFVNIQKVEKSKEQLLFTDKSIAEIAAYFSFSSQGYFQTVFKRFTGTTPNAFRNSGAAEGGI